MHPKQQFADLGSPPIDTNAKRTRFMHWRRNAMAAASVAALMLAGASVGMTGTATASGTNWGCPYGAVCIYPGPSFSGTPLKYYSYGAHQLYNQVGMHRVYNNQYGGATVQLCTGGSPGYATNCGSVFPAGYYEDGDLRPYNAIYLQP